MWKLLLNYAKRHLWKVICEAWKKNKGEGWWGEYSLMHNSSPLSPPSLPITPPFTPLSSSFPTSPPTAQESLEKRTIRNVTTYLEAIWKCPHNRVNIWAAWNICLIDLWIVKNENIAIFIFASASPLKCPGHSFTLYFDTPILMSPLTNVFNFEILFSLGYDEGDWLSMKSLFKCHQGYIPISRQQAAIALRSSTIILVIKSVTMFFLLQDEARWFRYEFTSQAQALYPV